MKNVKVIPTFSTFTKIEVFSMCMTEEDDKTEEMPYWFVLTVTGAPLDIVFAQIDRAITRNLYDEIVRLNS